MPRSTYKDYYLFCFPLCGRQNKENYAVKFQPTAMKVIYLHVIYKLTYCIRQAS